MNGNNSMMMIAVRALAVLGVLFAVVAGANAFAAEEAGKEPTHFPIKEPERQSWSFAGFLGRYDQGQLQRGFQIYKEVCGACHGLKLVAFRNLAQPGGPGFTEAQAKAIAAEYEFPTGKTDDDDEPIMRPGKLFDHFPTPAFDAEGGSPPDLSLIAKARHVSSGFPGFLLDIFTQYQEGGPDYIYSLLTGYQEAPEGVKVDEGLHYNPHFIAGKALAMAPPLSDGRVDYTDGTEGTLKNYSRDVTAFLMWTAEPHLDARKRIGLQVMIFLIVFATLMWFVKRRIWAKVEH